MEPCYRACVRAARHPQRSMRAEPETRGSNRGLRGQSRHVHGRLGSHRFISGTHLPCPETVTTKPTPQTDETSTSPLTVTTADGREPFTCKHRKVRDAPTRSSCKAIASRRMRQYNRSSRGRARLIAVCDCCRFEPWQHYNRRSNALSRQESRRSSTKCTPIAGVEVVPLVAGAAPIVIRGPVVGLVVGVLGLLVVEAGGLLVVTSLRVQRRGLFLRRRHKPTVSGSSPSCRVPPWPTKRGTRA